MKKNRLSKILSQAGFASRRKCEELIFSGRVQVNGEVVTKPQHLTDPLKDQVFVDGKKMKGLEPKVYYLINKPRGYVCSNEERYTYRVIDLFPKKHRLFTVGRLDKESCGLLIVTNDGSLSHQVMHPSFEVQKEYLVKTNFEVSVEDLEIMRLGITIDTAFVKPLKVQKVRKNTVKITLKEGKKHEVRKLVGQTGLEVKELTRIRIGNLHLGNLEPGQFKQVSLNELESVFN